MQRTTSLVFSTVLVFFFSIINPDWVYSQSLRFGSTKSIQLNLGHAGAVHSVAFAPNGQFFVTASADATVRVWSVADRCLLRVLTGHVGAVRAVAVSPDSQTILSAGDDNRLIGWNPVTDFPKVTLPLTAPAYSIAVAPTGLQVAIGQTDGRLGLWTVGAETARFLPIQPDHKRLTALAFNTDGSRLLIGDQAGAVRLLTAEGKAVSENKQAHRGAVRWVGFGPDGSPFSGGEDKLVHGWPISLIPSAQSFFHPGWVTGASFLGNDQLITACNDGNLRRWNLTSGREETIVAVGSGALATIAGQPGGRVIATGGFNQVVGLWDVETKQATMQTKGRGVRITEALNDSMLVLAGPGGGARVVMRNGSLVRLADSEPKQTIEVINSQDQRGRAVLTNGQVKLVVDHDTIPLPDHHRNGVRAVCYGPGGLLFTGGADGRVIAWDSNSQQVLNMLVGNGLPVFLLDFDEVLGEVFMITGDHTARLWNPATGQITLSAIPTVVSARLGSRSVMVVSADGLLRILERMTREETYRITVFGDDETRPDWLVQTADGHYDGSETAIRSAYIVQEFQKHPLDPARRQVGLLRTVLGAGK